MYFWYCEILNIVLFIEFLSGFNWKLVVLFLVVWIIVYLCMVKGIKLFGKVRYFFFILNFVDILWEIVISYYS